MHILYKQMLYEAIQKHFEKVHSDVNLAIYAQKTFCYFSFLTLRTWEKTEIMIPRDTKDISEINRFWKKKYPDIWKHNFLLEHDSSL